MTFNLAGLLSRTQDTINALDSNSNNEQLIMSAYDLSSTDTACYVETNSDLPDLFLHPEIPDGFVVYVKDEDRFVVSSGIDWLNIDGTPSGVVFPYILWAWGNNHFGALGLPGTYWTSSPMSVVGGITTWADISIRKTFSAAIKTDGTLWTWGQNDTGQLGNGTKTNNNSPTTVIGENLLWVQVSAGSEHVAAIKADGTLWTWGSGFYGALGHGSQDGRSSPGTTVGGGDNWSQVSAGTDCVMAVKTDGTLWTWGENNSFGRLGTGETTSFKRLSPGTTIGGGTNWKQVSYFFSHAAAVKTDGTLWCWGSNATGCLGDGTNITRESPGTTIGGGTTWSQVSAGEYFTAAVKTDGTLWTWGTNSDGQLGNNTLTGQSSPITTAGGGTTWNQVSVGQGIAGAVKTDGTLWMWGNNQVGQLGDNTQTRRSSPVTPAGGGTNWSQVSAGYQVVGAIQTA